jgi:outer membrane translocation and assembly module TamA
MNVRLKWYFRYLFFAATILSLVEVGSSQPAQTVPTNYPTHLPYSFSNLVWWTNDGLRELLKERIPGLADEIAPTAGAERKVRDELKALLKEKGIVAEVQSQEPSNFSLSAERAPGAPGPAIVFSVLSPQVLVDRVVLTQVPDGLMNALSESLRRREGHEYSGGQDWLVRSNAEEELNSKGYLEAQIDVTHDAPRRDGDHYLVNLLVSVKPGPQYRISSITADGGPLLRGRDLSSFFAQKAGDVAGAGPFGRLAGELRALYWHNGYADVDIHGPPVFDRSSGLVSYHLDVAPGPVYHLRSLTIHNLDAQQERKARELLGIKPGDVFDQMAVNGLYHKLSAEPALTAYGFTFGPMKDKTTANVDLTLDFYKTSDKSSVTTK